MRGLLAPAGALVRLASNNSFLYGLQQLLMHVHGLLCDIIEGKIILRTVIVRGLLSPAGALVHLISTNYFL